MSDVRREMKGLHHFTHQQFNVMGREISKCGVICKHKITRQLGGVRILFVFLDKSESWASPNTSLKRRCEMQRKIGIGFWKTCKQKYNGSLWVAMRVRADPCSSRREMVLHHPLPLPLHWFGFREDVGYHVPSWLVFYSVKIFMWEFSLVSLERWFPYYFVSV